MVLGTKVLIFCKLSDNNILKSSGENRKDKGIPFPNLGANILLGATIIGANNLFLILLLTGCVMVTQNAVKSEGLRKKNDKYWQKL